MRHTPYLTTWQRLRAVPCAQPYPLLEMLARSALLHDEVGSAAAHGDGAVELELQLHHGDAPPPSAAVYVALARCPSAQAVRITDATGHAHFRLHTALPCELQLSVYLMHRGLVSAMASLTMQLQACAGPVRLGLRLD